MANNKNDTRKRIVDFIEQEEKSGFFDDQIRKQLYNSGYDPQEIEDYIKSAHVEAQGVKKESRHHDFAKKVFMILLVISLVFNVILITVIQLGNGGVEVQKAATTVTTLSSFDKYQEMGMTEEESREIRYCTNVNRMQCEGDALMSRAIETNDRSLCEKIPKKDIKDECLLKSQYQLAAINNDVNLCNQLPSHLTSKCKDIFYSAKAEVDGLDYCNQIVDADMREDCVRG